MRLVIEGHLVDVDPVSLEIEGSSFYAGRCEIRDALAYAVFGDMLEKLRYTEPPDGLVCIMRACEMLSEIALLACHYGCEAMVREVHAKLCSHYTECEAKGACEKEMAYNAAQMLCKVHNLLKEFSDERSEDTHV